MKPKPLAGLHIYIVLYTGMYERLVISHVPELIFEDKLVDSFNFDKTSSIICVSRSSIPFIRRSSCSMCWRISGLPLNSGEAGTSLKTEPANPGLMLSVLGLHFTNACA